MNTLYLDSCWRDVIDLVVNGDYQAKLMSGEESWTFIHKNNKFNASRNRLLLKLVDAQVPHRFVDFNNDKILVVGT